MKTLLLLVVVLVISGLAIAQVAQTAVTGTAAPAAGPTTAITFTVSTADLACVGRVQKQDPVAWLTNNLTRMVAQCASTERAATLQAIGISHDLRDDGLTPAEVDMIVSLRAAANTAAQPATATAQPKTGQ